MATSPSTGLGLGITDVASATHDGKVIVVASCRDGILRYSIRQSGFEDSAVTPVAETSMPGFEDWRPLPLDRAGDDPSVTAFEAATLVTTSGEPIIRSIYGRAAARSSTGRVKLLSGLDYLYLFRVSSNNTLLLNRFVLDGIANELVPKLEVRYHRSGRKLTPEGGRAGSGAVDLDTLAYRDTTQKPFFEPAKELSFLGRFDPRRPWFSVELTPTDEHGKHRWNFFVLTGGELRLFSVAVSDEGLIDPSDQRRVRQDPDRVDRQVTVTLPGITERVIKLPGRIIDGFDSTTYHNQIERETKAGKQLLKESTRVMLAVPIEPDGGGRTMTAALSFKVGTTGFLSRVDRIGDNQLLNGQAKEVLLPPTALDEIKLWADRDPPPSGDIAQLEETAGGATRLIPTETASARPPVEAGQDARLWGADAFDGAYVAQAVDGEAGTFEIELPAPSPDAKPDGAADTPPRAHWEVVEDDAGGLVFENMIGGYEYLGANRLRISCVSHNLSEGDAIRIRGTRSHDGIYPIVEVGDDNSFVIDRPWSAGEVVNLSIRPRRGLVFDGAGDGLTAGPVDIEPRSPTDRLQRTLGAWVYVDAPSDTRQTLFTSDADVLDLAVEASGHLSMTTGFADGHRARVTDPDPLPVGRWVHVAASVDYQGDRTGETGLRLLRAGAEVASETVRPLKPLHLPVHNLRLDGVALPISTMNFAMVRPEQITIEGWISPTGSGRGVLASWLQHADLELAVVGTAERRVLQWSVHGHALEGTMHLGDGAWHHVAASYDPGSGRSAIFVNGVPDGEARLEAGPAPRRTTLDDASAIDKPFVLGALGAPMLDLEATGENAVMIESPAGTWRQVAPGQWQLTDASGSPGGERLSERPRRPERLHLEGSDHDIAVDLTAPRRRISRIRYQVETASGAWQRPPHRSTADILRFRWSHDGRRSNQQFTRRGPASWTLAVAGIPLEYEEYRRDGQRIWLKRLSPAVLGGVATIGNFFENLGTRLGDLFSGRGDNRQPDLEPAPELSRAEIDFAAGTLTLDGQVRGTVFDIDYRPADASPATGFLAEVYREDGQHWQLRSPLTRIWVEKDADGEIATFREIARTGQTVTIASLADGYRIVFDAVERRWSRIDDSVSTDIATDFQVRALNPQMAGEDRYRGFLADVRVWAASRSADAIAATRYQALTGAEDGLIAFWPLARTTAKDASDLSRSKAHLDLSELQQAIGAAAASDPGGDLWAGMPHRAPGRLAHYTGDTFPERYSLAAGLGQDDSWLKGRLSEVQLWDVNPTAESIRQNMHLQLAGNEYGLSHYWRCAGIVAEETPGSDRRLTPDLVADGADARIGGDVYVSACELPRRNSVGLAARFSNGDLVAVTQGATYRETFEFRAVSFAGEPWTLDDLNDADGRGNPIFKLRYWGRASRTSAEQVELSSAAVRQSELIDVGDGWFRIGADFTIPDDVSLIRCFEIDQVRGLAGGDELPEDEWAVLSIRRHRMELISDSITKSRYVDELGHIERIGHDVALGQALAELPGLERDDARVRAEIGDLNERLKWAEQKDRLTSHLASATAERTRLERSFAAAKQVVADFTRDPLNHILALECVGSSRFLTLGSGPFVRAAGKGTTDAAGWVIEGSDADGYTIRRWDDDGYLAVRDRTVTEHHSEDERLLGFLWKTGERTWTTTRTYENEVYLAKSPVKEARWRLHDLGGQGKGPFSIANRVHGVSLAQVQWLISDVGLVVATTADHVPSARWRLVPKQGLRPVWYPRQLARREAARDRIERHLSRVSARIAWIRGILDANDDDLDRLRERRAEWVVRLNGITSAIARANQRFLDAQAAPSGSNTMGLVAQDTDGLKTYGALLGFVTPGGAVAAKATAEGNVQLSYFDQRGRMCFADYDATSDSANGTFEEWLGARPPVCVNLASPGAALRLEHPITLPEAAHTVEAWFYYPPPDQAQASDNPGSIGTPFPLSCLTSDAEGNEAAIAIASGRRLGTVIDGFFHDAGVDLSQELERGWHHVAARTEGTVTAFFLNGAPVGRAAAGEEPMPPVFALRSTLPGRELKTVRSNATTQGLTLLIWIRIDTGYGGYGPLLRLVRDSLDLDLMADRPVLRHHGPQGDSEVVSDTAIPRGRWTHVAVSIGNAVAIVYINGIEAMRGELTSPLATDPTPLRLFPDARPFTPAASRRQEALRRRRRGVPIHRPPSSRFVGLVGDLQLWGQALGAEEVGERMFSRAPDTTDGLVAHWPMRLGEVDGRNVIADVSGSQGPSLPLSTDSQATLAEDIVELAGTRSAPITVLGNAATGDAPAGRIAHLRLWSTALSDEEIAAHRLVTLTGNEPDLLGCFPLDDPGVSTTESVCLTGRNRVTLDATQVIASTAPIGHPGARAAILEPGPEPGIQASGAPLGKDFCVELWVKIDDDVDAAANAFRLFALERAEFEVSIKNAPWAQQNGVVSWLLTLECVAHARHWTLTLPAPELHSHRWVHVCATFDGTDPHIFIDGRRRVPQAPAEHRPFMPQPGPRSSEEALIIGPFAGQVAEIRLWGRLRDADEIKLGMRRRATGREDGLLLCLPLDAPFGAAQPLANLALQRFRIVHSPRARALRSDDLPIIPGPSVCTAEYSTVGPDPEDSALSRALLRRFYCCADGRGDALLRPGKRVEELVLKWIGNAQFEPTLLGYIEGPPPVPSENLTVDYDYDGATAVELTLSDEVEYTWSRNTDVGGGLDINAFLGVAWGVSGGIGIETRISEGQAGLRASANTVWGRQASSDIRASSTSTARDQLELRGSFELEPAFPHLGNRYVPKNVGYALVVSGMADVFITRMKRTGRMVAYEVRPAEDMPPDVNTITFLINPAYTLNGSLDGLIGSHAADQRFYRHVPRMRSQHGSRYPASYFDIAHAYRLKSQIERWDKDREAYFVAFDAESVMGLDDGLLDQVPDDDFQGSNLASLAEEGASSPTDGEDQRSERERSSDDAAQLRKKYEKDKEKQEAETEKRVNDIERRFADNEKQQEAQAAFKTWQRKMENIQLRAAKRNIQNTYVWDADGGVRFEEESFANTIEHTIGGSFNLNAALGADINAQISAFKGELQLMGNLSMSQTLSKSRRSTRSFELDVRLDRVERKGITGADDRPVHPGEKVDRYRFMSFYLDGDTSHFHDFFGHVVDPEWLMSNDEEARALRQIARGRANKTWRVLHRVTYVERPALMGFGRDLRESDDLAKATEEVHNYFDSLEQDNADLRDRISELSAQIKAMSAILQGLDGGGVRPAAPSASGSNHGGPGSAGGRSSTPAGSAPAVDAGAAPKRAAGAGIDINTATPEQLQTLVGIGPEMAAAIIDYRRANGAFRSVDELIEIAGIGPVLLARLRPQLAPIGSGNGGRP